MTQRQRAEGGWIAIEGIAFQWLDYIHDAIVMSIQLSRTHGFHRAYDSFAFGVKEKGFERGCIATSLFCHLHLIPLC